MLENVLYAKEILSDQWESRCKRTRFGEIDSVTLSGKDDRKMNTLVLTNKVKGLVPARLVSS